MKKVKNVRLDAALEYADCGWLVNALRPNSKALVGSGKSVLESATLDHKLIRELWGRRPGLNIGLVPGKESGFCVLDVDVKDGQPGVAALKRLERRIGKLPKTRREQTWSGGEHIWFRHPGDDLSNRRGSGPLHGLELFAAPHNLVVAPSVVNDKPYVLLNDSKLANVPDALVAAFNAATPNSGVTATIGLRNNTLYAHVRRLRDQNMEEQMAWAEAITLNGGFDPPLGEREVRSTFKSAWNNAPLNTASTRSGRVLVRPGGLPEAVDQAFQILIPRAQELKLFVNAGALVRPYHVEREGFPGVDGVPEVVQSLELGRVSLANCSVDISRAVTFFRERVTGGGISEVPVDCPTKVAQSLFEAPDRLRSLPQIERLSEVPIFGDSALHSAPGLHGGTWINAPTGVALPKRLSKKVAATALNRVAQYVAEFPFEDDVSRGVALALLLTSALRPSLGAAPGFLCNKPQYGAGATMLAKLAGVVLTGRTPAVMPYSRKEEATKQLNAMLIAGTSVLILDNLPEGVPFADALVAQILSEPQVQVRELGTGRVPVVDCRRLVIATGVNVTVGDDLVRRMLTCRLDPKIERAEARVFKRPELLHETQRARAELLTDLFTITAAYLSQQKRVAVGALAGYDQWVRWVAEPLRWLGVADVIESSREASASDGTTVLLSQLLPLIAQLHARPEHKRFAGVSVKDMMMKVVVSDGEWSGDGSPGWRLRSELHSVLGEATGAKMFNDEPQLNPVHVGRWLLRIKGRVVGKQRLVEGGRRTGQPLWGVETVTEDGDKK